MATSKGKALVKVKLNPHRSKESHSLEHAKKMSAYRRMDNDRGNPHLVKEYENAVNKASVSKKKNYKY